MAVTTQAISVKIDLHTMAALDKEAEVSGVKRNRLINMAIDHYIKYLDSQRYERLGLAR